MLTVDVIQTDGTSSTASKPQKETRLAQTVADMKSLCFQAQSKGITPGSYITIGAATYKVSSMNDEFVTAHLWVKGEATDEAKLPIRDAMKAKVQSKVQTRLTTYSVPWTEDSACWSQPIARGIAVATILHVARAQPSLDGKLQLLIGPNAVLAARNMKAGTLKIHWLCQLTCSCWCKCKYHLAQSLDGAGIIFHTCVIHIPIFTFTYVHVVAMVTA